MKKYFLFILPLCVWFLVATDAFAFSDVGTHPAITETAAYQSELGCQGCTYLKDILGFENGLDEVIGSDKIITILKNGSKTEDSGIEDPPDSLLCDRGLNHFFDPTIFVPSSIYPSRGLNEKVYGHQFLMNINPALLLLVPTIALPVVFSLDYHFEGKENPQWGIGPYHDYDTPIDTEPTETQQIDNEYNQYSWSRGRLAYFAALTAKEEAKRNQLFARTFRSVGQVVHLLQDMAVPAHVRNDMRGHLYFQKYLIHKYGLKNIHSFKKWIGNDFETYVEENLSVTGNGAVKSFDNIWHYWTSGDYLLNNKDINSSLDGGLAEFTTANFLSANKMLDADHYDHPSENDGSVFLDTVTSKDGKTDDAYYFKMETGAQVKHLAHTSILGKYGVHLFDNLDDICHADYAAKLVPKAVDYSTGLINYFFRGTLGICPPERWVYSIADGGLNPAQFTYIKAQVYNSTDYNGGGDPPMGPGSLWAVARYKSGADTYLYSVSGEISDVELTTELQEFEFSFANDPIPADITDLTLQVVYKGTLGNEENIAVAVGMKDLNEPAHFVLFNATEYAFFGTDDTTQDYYYIDNNMFNTASDMETGGPKPAECTLNESTGNIECSQDTCVYPVQSTVEIEFNPGIKVVDTPHVTYDLPPGRHGRMIVLGDPETSLKANITISAPYDFPYLNDSPCVYSEIKISANVDSIIAQGVDPVAQDADFREISMHNGVVWSNIAVLNLPETLIPPLPDNWGTTYEDKARWYTVSCIYPNWPLMAVPEPVPFDSVAFNP